jgi:aryl-alcohol dehydrogenase-like predicted oxidoreductase
MSSKLALGTVQFGQSYGVANRDGQTPLEEVRQILNLARQSGLDTLDTARAYGNSERVLGECGAQGWRIVSKLPARQTTGGAAHWARDCLAQSLNALRVESLDGLLLHQPLLLLGADGTIIYETLLTLKAEGRIRKLGISVYEPAELDALIPRYAIDLVQLPFNLVDRRMLHTGWLDRLHQAGIEVHARSCFLQGLLLMPQGGRPARFDRWRGLWQAWHDWLAQSGQTPLRACLGYSLAQPQISRVLVGTESAAQLAEILEAAQRPALSVPSALTVNDPDLINPSRWTTL